MSLIDTKFLNENTSKFKKILYWLNFKIYNKPKY